MNLKRFECAIAAFALCMSSTAAFAADTKPAAPSAPITAQRYGTWGVDLDGMDRSVKPGDDFFKYVNGKWAANTQIPADKTGYGAFAILGDLSEARVHALLDQWAADKTLKSGSDEAKVAMVYRAYLDEAAAEKLDAKPIQSYLDAVKKAQTREDIARIMGSSARGFGSSFFGANVGDDAKNPDKYALYVSQSGLGLADREFYLRDNFKPQKERYQKYVADMLRLAGWDDPDKNAADVVALETKIAEAHWTRADSRNRDKTYNPTTIADLEKNAPGFPWMIAFKAAGLDGIDRAVARQDTALPKIAKVFADSPVATLQAWEAFHVIDDAAPLLSKRFVDTQWEFRSKFLNGTKEQRPLEARGRRGRECSR
ncbi:MAG: putative endopeptidase [Thermoanaerobaculia bacterium]|jgi:putative endopeptidase|nr:putative endopeptidase [Thermoanaerobaculia bacterium]